MYVDRQEQKDCRYIRKKKGRNNSKKKHANDRHTYTASTEI